MAERWWIDEEHRAALTSRAPLDVAAWMQPGPERLVLSSDRQSAAVLWNGDVPLLVKWRVPIAGRKGKTWLRASRERAEADAMRAARDHGIPCPQAWAVGERRQLGVLVGAVFIRAFDAQAQTAAEASATDPQVAVDMALALRRWHDAGFRHGDCYPKNVLLGGAAGEPRPIGCPKGRFVAPGPRLDDARLKDLAQWAVGSANAAALGDPFAFLTFYGEAEGLPDYEALVEAVLPLYEKIMTRKAERVRTRPQREPEGPPAPQPLPPA